MKISSKKKVNVSRNAEEYSRSCKEMDTLFPPFSPSNLVKFDEVLAELIKFKVK